MVPMWERQVKKKAMKNGTSISQDAVKSAFNSLGLIYF
jgi:hypothetical protein